MPPIQPARPNGPAFTTGLDKPAVFFHWRP